MVRFTDEKWEKAREKADEPNEIIFELLSFYIFIKIRMYTQPVQLLLYQCTAFESNFVWLLVAKSYL